MLLSVALQSRGSKGGVFAQRVPCILRVGNPLVLVFYSCVASQSARSGIKAKVDECDIPQLGRDTLTCNEACS